MEDGQSACSTVQLLHRLSMRCTAEIMQSLKPGHQTLLFSATMPVEIEALANQYLTKPVTVKVSVQRVHLLDARGPRGVTACLYVHKLKLHYLALQVGQVSTPTASVLQGLQKTTEVNKTDDVVMLLLEEQQQAQQNGHAMGLTVVFVERKVWPAAVCTLCACEGWQAQQGRNACLAR